MKPGERDFTGRLNVPDEDLMKCAMGCAWAAALSIETVQSLLKCDRFEAQQFQEGAMADLMRIRTIREGKSWA